MNKITQIFEELSKSLEIASNPTTKKKKPAISIDQNVDFLKKKYITSKTVTHFYDDFKSLGSDREEFNKIQKRFLQAVFEQALCNHYCVNPIVNWTLYTNPINPSENDNDDDDDDEVNPPFFSIDTKNYKEGNLYNYMVKWIDSSKFDATIASVILYGIASAFIHISNNGYSYYNLTPRNIYLDKKKINLNDDDEIEILIPQVGDLGLLDDRDFTDPFALMPEELSQTNDPQIIKFLVSLYFLFQQPANDKDECKSIIKDFYKLDGDSIPKDFIFDDNTDSKIIGNSKLFYETSELYIFDDSNTDVLDAFSKQIETCDNKGDETNSENLFLQSSSDIFSSSLSSTKELANIKTINKAILSIQSFGTKNESTNKAIDSQFLIYFPFLAIAYASGDLESYPNLCHAAYYAQRADHITSTLLPTTILTKFSTAVYENDAERLFHEGEVLEGNAYAFSEEGETDSTVNKVLTMAANKYKESAKLGFDKAKTRLAMLIINDKSSSETTKKNALERLLIPAAKTDPLAMFEVGMHYFNENNLNESLNYLEKAYTNNNADSVYQLARLHHKIALSKLNEKNDDSDDANSKDEIIDNLKKSLNYYRIAAKLYDNEEASSMRDEIQKFLTKNGVEIKE